MNHTKPKCTHSIFTGQHAIPGLIGKIDETQSEIKVIMRRRPPPHHAPSSTSSSTSAGTCNHGPTNFYHDCTTPSSVHSSSPVSNCRTGSAATSPTNCKCSSASTSSSRSSSTSSGPKSTGSDSDEIRVYGLVAAVAIVCYLNGLAGDFVHDDIPAITINKDVLGTTSVAAVFQNDFWGTPMADANSHKSYRPLTILSFRWVP